MDALAASCFLNGYHLHVLFCRISEFLDEPVQFFQVLTRRKFNRDCELLTSATMIQAFISLTVDGSLM